MKIVMKVIQHIIHLSARYKHYTLSDPSTWTCTLAQITVVAVSDWTRCVCCLIWGMNLLGQFTLLYKAAVWSVSSLPTNKLLIQPKKHTIYHDNQIYLQFFEVLKLCAYCVSYVMFCSVIMSYSIIIFIHSVRLNPVTSVCMILRKKLWVICLVWESPRK